MCLLVWQRNIRVLTSQHTNPVVEIDGQLRISLFIERTHYPIDQTRTIDEAQGGKTALPHAAARWAGAAFEVV